MNGITLVTMKELTHATTTVIALAGPRAFTGIISDITNNGTGPHPRENATM